MVSHVAEVDGVGDRGVLRWRRTNFAGVGSYAGEEGLHSGESGGSICGCLAANEGILRGRGCEGERGEGGSEGHVGKERLHIEEFEFWWIGLSLELRVIWIIVVDVGDGEMITDELKC